jgi:hypothetical protein
MKAHRTEEGRHPQGPEDDSERAAGETDDEAEDDGRRDPRLGGRPGAKGRNQQVEAVPGEHGGNAGEEGPGRDEVAREAADERTGDRGGRHPGDDAAVDPARTRMAQAARGCSGRADRDVRPGRGAGVTGYEQQRRQAQRSEHEPDSRAEVAGNERSREG